MKCKLFIEIPPNNIGRISNFESPGLSTGVLLFEVLLSEVLLFEALLSEVLLFEALLSEVLLFEALLCEVLLSEVLLSEVLLSEVLLFEALLSAAGLIMFVYMIIIMMIGNYDDLVNLLKAHKTQELRILINMQYCNNCLTYRPSSL